ncbi:MAG: HD domain-containing protein [Saprospiraceae bacterium]|nr:HD domain-containing protein [Saprospiraceae bacterium]
MNATTAGHHSVLINVNLEAELLPETTLERQLLQIPDFVKGLLWGIPRYGHPEGEVYKHVREVLCNIDKLVVDPISRERLRLTAFSHDTFKYIEDKSTPRDWSKHHGICARRFMQDFTNDFVVLDLIEHHDEAYYSWRCIHLLNQNDEGTARLQQLMERMSENLQLYYLFFKCDTRTGDKNPAPLHWFENVVKDIELVHF